MNSDLHPNFFDSASSDPDNEHTSNDKLSNIPMKSPVKAVPLSHNQKRLWYLSKWHETSGSYNLYEHFILDGPLEVSTLEFSIRDIIERHTSLRTTFHETDNEAVSQINDHIPFKIGFVNLKNLPESHQHIRIKSIAIQVARHEFDLSKGPLVQVKVIWLGGHIYHLIINMHHIISDGTSQEIFKKELGIFYNARISGSTPELPVLHPVDLDENISEVSPSELTSFWTSKLEGAPELLEIPGQKRRPAIQSYEGLRHSFTIAPESLTKFRSFCKENQVTTYTGLMAAYKLLLSKYTGKEDIIVGSPFSGRNDERRKGHIHFFVNTVPLRTYVDPNLNFRQFIQETKRTIKQAFKYQDLPFEKIVEAVNPERNPSFSPIFQFMLAYQNYAKEPFELNNIRIDHEPKTVVHAKFDITLEIIENQHGELHCGIDYNTDLYDGEFIRQIGDHFQLLLNRLVSHAHLPLKHIPLLSTRELQIIVHEWNRTEFPYPKGECMHQLFEKRVQLHPDAIALSYNGDSMTYRTLNNKANQLAHRLLNEGVKREDFIGIEIDRSFDMVIAVLGVMKAGAAYVAIDPTYPQDRKKFMTDDAGISILLTAKGKSSFSSKTIQTIAIQGNFMKSSNVGWEENPELSVSEDQLAYMIYTSGSTGTPKGVLIEHKGLPNLIYDHIKKYKLRQGNCVLQFASLSFDASICEMGMALLSGATLCLADKDDILPGPGLIRLMNNQKISHVTLPPSALSILPESELPYLKVITVTGEACPELLVDRWSENCRFFNGYGPSEVTIGATISEFSKGSPKTSIGKPFANYKVYILDKYLNPVPAGLPGEIHIGGLGLARGYHNRPEITTNKFVQNPFGHEGEKIYKTGDIGKFDKDGSILFIGRNDHQVKLRGMRIELGEIESALNNIRGILQSKVIVRPVNGVDQLIAFYITNGDDYLKPGVLQEKISGHLPKHMIPSVFHRLDKFPKLPNDKIDEKALIEVRITSSFKEVNDTPENPIEKSLKVIWQEVLGTPEIGVNDNFFDMGGHSLLAAKLVVKIKDSLDIEIPVSTLMKAPTIKTLAVFLQNQNSSDQETQQTIVSFNKGKGEDREPIYFFHTPSGHVISYRDLINHLPKDIPVFGIQIDELIADKKPYFSLDEMALFYAQSIKKSQPRQPVNLAGYCFGGLIAFEVANHLVRLGVQVSNLYLIGSQFPDKHIDKVVSGETNLISLHNSEGSIPVFKRLGRFAYFTRKGIQKHIWRQTYNYYKSKNKALPDKVFDIKLINHKNLEEHIPGYYNGNLVLIQPKEKDELKRKETASKWHDLIGGEITLLSAKGSQSSMLSSPFAEHIAKLIKRHLLEDQKVIL